MMKVIAPLTMTDAIYDASSLTETDHAAWSSAIGYGATQRVIYVPNHSIYECVLAHGATVVTPPNNLTNWVRVSATNKWKPFDKVVGDQCEGIAGIPATFTLTVDSRVNSIALFRLNTFSVQVVVSDTVPTVLYDETMIVVNTDEIVDWLSFYLWDGAYSEELLIENLPAYPGYQIDITLDAEASEPRVGEIVLGLSTDLGTAQASTSIGIKDYSRKERDTFGNPVIIERAFVDTANFYFNIPVADENRVKRVLSALRATAAVYVAGSDVPDRTVLVFGFYNEFDIPLGSAGVSFVNLEVEGLV